MLWQRAIDGVRVWIGPALVTANFCGTCCPRFTIRSSVLSHLWKVRNEQRNGLESKTSSPINIIVKGNLFHSSPLSPSVCVSPSLCCGFPDITPCFWLGSSERKAACTLQLLLPSRTHWIILSPASRTDSQHGVKASSGLKCKVLISRIFLICEKLVCYSLRTSFGHRRFGLGLLRAFFRLQLTFDFTMTLAAKLEDIEVTLEHLLMDVFVSKLQFPI